MTPTTYYIWKWADNDVPGKPNDVFAALMRGRLHPALQAFDAQPLLRVLDEDVAKRRRRGEDWDWTICADSATGLTRFITITGPVPRTDCQSLYLSAWQLGIAWYNEQKARLSFGPPKHSCMSYADLPWVYEVTEAELPVLLKQISSLVSNPYAILTDRRLWFVQAFTDGKRWLVEWRENRDFANPQDYDQWIAGHRPVSRKRSRIKSASGSGVPCRASERLTYAETLDIFRAFLRGEPRPSRYHWRSIKAELK